MPGGTPAYCCAWAPTCSLPSALEEIRRALLPSAVAVREAAWPATCAAGGALVRHLKHPCKNPHSTP